MNTQLASCRLCTSSKAYSASTALHSVLWSGLIGSSSTRHSSEGSSVLRSRSRQRRQYGKVFASTISAARVEKETLQPARSKELETNGAAKKKRNKTDNSQPSAPHLVQYAVENGSPIKRVPPKRTAETGAPWKQFMQKIAVRAGDFAKIKVRLSDTEVIEDRRNLLNYDALRIIPQSSPLDQKLLVPWALDTAQWRGKSGRELLEEEVRLFVQHIEPTPIERLAREKVAFDLMALIAKILKPNGKSEIFGSERTGLAVATSDIDVRVDFTDTVIAEGSKDVLEKIMRKLAAAMERNGHYTLVVARYGAHPIINAQHKGSGIHVQVTASSSTAPQDSVTLRYLQELPHLRSLYTLLRAALGIRGLVDVFSGGTGSYGLLMMLVASIQRRSSYPPVTLTDQLFHFLDFYAKLDCDRYGVSVSPPKLFKKHNPWDVPVKDFIEAARRRGDLVRSAQWAISQRRLYQPYLLCLQDPANPFNDLSRKSNAIKHIAATLTDMRTELALDMEAAARAAAQGRYWEGESILLRFVGRCHEVNVERRRRLEEYGLKVMQEKRQKMVNASPSKMFKVGEARAG